MNTERYFIFFYLYVLKSKDNSSITGNGRIHYDSDEGFPSFSKVEKLVCELHNFESVVILNFAELNEEDFRTSQGK